MRRAAVLVVCWLALGAVAAPAAAQQTHLLVITGLGGEADYTDQFHEWATTLLDAAAARYELPAGNITYLGEKTDLDPERIQGRSSRENVTAAMDDIAARAEPGDHVVIVLFGHGSFADTARINLPGRDLSADDFAGLLRNGSTSDTLTSCNIASPAPAGRSSRSCRARTAW